MSRRERLYSLFNSTLKLKSTGYKITPHGAFAAAVYCTFGLFALREALLILDYTRRIRCWRCGSQTRSYTRPVQTWPKFQRGATFSIAFFLGGTRLVPFLFQLQINWHATSSGSTKHVISWCSGGHNFFRVNFYPHFQFTVTSPPPPHHDADHHHHDHALHTGQRTMRWCARIPHADTSAVEMHHRVSALRRKLREKCAFFRSVTPFEHVMVGELLYHPLDRVGTSTCRAQLRAHVARRNKAETAPYFSLFSHMRSGGFFKEIYLVRSRQRWISLPRSLTVSTYAYVRTHRLHEMLAATTPVDRDDL